MLFTDSSIPQIRTSGFWNPPLEISCKRIQLYHDVLRLFDMTNRPFGCRASLLLRARGSALAAWLVAACGPVPRVKPVSPDPSPPTVTLNVGGVPDAS